MRAVSPVQQIFDFRSRNLFTCWFQVNKSDKGKGGEGGIFLFILKFLFLDQILQLRWHMKALLSFFQQRYRDPRCCANWLCGKQKRGYIRTENEQAELSIHSKILIPQPNIEVNVAYESPIIPLSKKSILTLAAVQIDSAASKNMDTGVLQLNQHVQRLGGSRDGFPF